MELSALALVPDNAFEALLAAIGIVGSICSVTFFFATFQLTHKYGIRFQRRLDRRDFADAILESRIQDVERFLCTSQGFCPRENLGTTSLPDDDSSLLH
jgi:hypothetical protein